MEENKKIPCTLCGKNAEKRIWYLDKCICDECSEKISETIGSKKKNSPKIVDYIEKDPCDKIDEFFKKQTDKCAFEFNVLIPILSGIIGYDFSKKIYVILITENISFNYRIILLLLFSLLPILAAYLLFCYRKNKQNSMDNEYGNDRKKSKCKRCIKAKYFEKSENTCNYCIQKNPFGVYSIYIALSVFSFGSWVYIVGVIAHFINIF